MKITHTKVSAVADGSDPAQVQPSDWNAEHTVVRRYNPHDWVGHANDADDDFMTGTLDTTGSRAAGATPWTSTALSGSTVSFEGPGLLRLSSQTSGTDTRAYVTQPAPSGNWKFRTSMRMLSFNARYGGAGIRLLGANKVRWFTPQGGGAGPMLQVQDRSLAEGWLSNLAATDNPWGTSTPTRLAYTSPLVLEVERSGTTLTYRYSSTGFEGTFIDVYSEDESVPGALSTIGLIAVATDTSSARGIGLFNWFRRIS